MIKFDHGSRRSLVRALLLSSAFLAGPALAQTDSAQQVSDPDNEAKALTEIVVSANRKSRAESLQDVAVSVSAFSGEQLEATHAINLTDIGRLTPGARLESNGTFPAATNFFVRGAGVNTTNPSDDPTVGVFVDGMYVGVNVGALTDLFDVESVEVLRGPQGTLFGRNVTGGAVLVRSRRPDGDFGVRGELGYGSFDEKSLKAAIEGPLVEGIVNAKLAILYRKHDGYFANAASPKDRIGASENLIFRPMLEFKPSDGLTITLIGEIGSQGNDGTPTKNLLIKPAASNITPSVPTEKFTLTANIFAHTDTEWRQIVGEAALDVGNGKITTTVSYRELQVDGQTEIDGTAAALFQFNTPTGLRQDQRTAEIIYAGSFSDTLDLTIGANIFDQNIAYQENRTVSSNAGVSNSAGRGLQDHTAGGVFAQGDWRFLPNLTLTVGGRYTIERKHARVANFGRCSVDFVTCNFETDDSKKWRDFTPKAALKWELSQDLTAYMSYTRGFRSGGYNLRNSTGLAGPYDPESVDAYEAGLKSVAFNRRLRANLAVYRNDFTGLQRQILDQNARQRILNAASSRIQGIEADLTVMPIDGLTLGGTLAYTDAKYNEYNGLDLTGDGVPDPILARNLKLTRIPKWTYSLFATYEAKIGDAGDIAAQVGFDHTAKRALNETNSYFLEAFGLLDASVTFSTPDKRFKIAAFVKNLTNQLYASTGVDVGTFRSVYIGAPRRYGVSFGFTF